MTGRGPLVALLAVNAVATIGTRISAIAIPWFVLTSTGSAAQTGLVTAVELAPYVIAKGLAGPLTDRLGQRRVSIVTDLASAVVFGLIPLASALGLLHLPLLLLLVAVGGAARGPGDSAKHTAIPLVAELVGAPLERATGLYGAIERGSGLVAPALAAGMISLLSATGAISVTAGCFAASAALVGLAIPRLDPTLRQAQDTALRPTQGVAGAGYWAQLRAGWSFLAADRVLALLVVMIMATNLLDATKVSVLLPVWARDGQHGIGAIGLLLTGSAGFSTVSSLLASWLGPRLPRRTTYFVAFAVAGPPPFLALGLELPVWGVAVVFCLAGFASGFLNPMIGAILFERIPRPLLGRVGSLVDALTWAAMPFGGLLGAGLIPLVGLGPTFLVVAVGYAVATAVPALGSDRTAFDRVPVGR
jgi:MFS family permease